RNPFISIVIPCYGRQELFNDTLWSCLEQDYEDFEVVVVDDASPQPIRIPYPADKVRLFRLAENRGESYARNFGVQQARGVYIKFMDSDDLFLDRSSLRRWAEFAHHTNADFIYSEALLFDVGGGRVGAFRARELDDRIYQGNFLAPSQLMVKRSVCLQNPFPEDIRYGEDFAFVVKVYSAGKYDCRRLPQRLIIVRLNFASQSQVYRGIGERYVSGIERARLTEGRSEHGRRQPPDRVPPATGNRKRVKNILLHRPHRQALGHLLETLGHANYLLHQHPGAVVYLKLSEVATSYAQELLYCDDRVFLWSPTAPPPDMEVEFDYRYAHYPRRLVLDPLELRWAEQNVDPNTIVICPGSGMPLQTPPLSLWVELVKRFPPDQPFLLTGRWTGPGHKTSNLSPVALVEAFADCPNVRFLFDVPLMRQVCAVRRARCFVSGHTGFMFVPDAVGTPFVVANSFHVPYRFAGAPYLYVHPHQSCYPCNRQGTQQHDGLCLRRAELPTTDGLHFPCATFDVDAVYRAIQEIWRGPLTVKESQRRVDKFMESIPPPDRIALRLHFGCHARRVKGSINCDVQQRDGADVVCPTVPLPFTAQCASRVDVDHFLERLAPSEAEAAMREWYRVLKNGGRLVIKCPDLRAVAAAFARGNNECLPVLYGAHGGAGRWAHWGYTADSLKSLAEATGFVKVKVSSAEGCCAKSFPCLRLEARKP
ncbi:MAG: glycosyltransferase, partial [Abditibacteriales bacterium]|nr:glycosyltransferase [Abditibacteriales bacterium]MDW8367570.1 glycosyltransferase [Abditibacteriales bacterium]